MSSILRCVFGALLCAAAATATAGEPIAKYILNRHTGEYLTAVGAANSVVAENQPVTLMRFDKNNPRQHLWYFEEVPGKPLHYIIWNALAGRALQLSPQNRSLMMTQPRWPGYQSFQTFKIRGLFAIESPGYGCLDAYFNNGRYGPGVGMWACHNGRNQDWYLESP